MRYDARARHCAPHAALEHHEHPMRLRRIAVRARTAARDATRTKPQEGVVFSTPVALDACHWRRHRAQFNSENTPRAETHVCRRCAARRRERGGSRRGCLGRLLGVHRGVLRRVLGGAAMGTRAPGGAIPRLFCAALRGVYFFTRAILESGYHGAHDARKSRTRVSERV